jgi:hypothetical protein
LERQSAQARKNFFRRPHAFAKKTCETLPQIGIRAASASHGGRLEDRAVHVTMVSARRSRAPGLGHIRSGGDG